MDILQILHDHWKKLRPFCDSLELNLRSPIDKAAAARLGEGMNLRTPVELQTFLTTVAGQVQLSYSFRTGDVRLNPIAKYVNTGGSPIGIGATMELIAIWDAWRDTWDSGSKGPKSEYLSFKALFPLAQTAGGNVLVLLDEGQPESKVVFLDHHDSDFDGTILADSLMEFMETWCGLACPNLDALPRFYSEAEQKISGETEFAQKWRKTLGLG